MTINKALKGQSVTFHGHDGNDYTALVYAVRKGIATIRYYAYVGGLNRRMVTAYVEDGSRLSPIQPVAQ